LGALALFGPTNNETIQQLVQQLNAPQTFTAEIYLNINQQTSNIIAYSKYLRGVSKQHNCGFKCKC
jgi:hypothetical protein